LVHARVPETIHGLDPRRARRQREITSEPRLGVLDDKARPQVDSTALPTLRGRKTREAAER
jgi:hypothetical protein